MLKQIIILTLITVMIQDTSSYLFDSKNTKSIADWYVVDDGVMGGLSQGDLSVSENGNALFSGYVTTENNGGFSSIRYAIDKKDVSKYTHVMLRIKGDGKAYQFRIQEYLSQRFSYITTFKTSGKWETIKIPLSEFYPSFRGYTLNRPNFSGQFIEEITFLIGNKTKETFRLEIENIYLE